VKLDKSMRKVDRISKAFCMLITSIVCYSMTMESGASFNPAFGMAQSLYMIGIYNNNGTGLGSSMAKISWVYMTAPYLGAALAAVVYKIHVIISHAPVKQHEPMDFMETENLHTEDPKN
jgi:glycerol uptake facilitator-like aquaporin